MLLNEERLDLEVFEWIALLGSLDFISTDGESPEWALYHKTISDRCTHVRKQHNTSWHTLESQNLRMDWPLCVDLEEVVGEQELPKYTGFLDIRKVRRNMIFSQKAPYCRVHRGGFYINVCIPFRIPAAPLSQISNVQSFLHNSDSSIGILP